jgi:hypothetical protein
MGGNEGTSAAAVPILGRLLATTLASRDAFAHAAYAVRSPAFAALFAERAEDQRRIARYLRTQLTCGVTPSASVTYAAPVYSSPVVALMPAGHDPGTLLGECLRVLEACALEFRRAPAAALSPSQLVSLGRILGQLRWTSDELFQLRSAFGTLRPVPMEVRAAASVDAPEPAGFVAPDDEVRWPVARRSAMSPGGDDGPVHATGETS